MRLQSSLYRDEPEVARQFRIPSWSAHSYPVIAASVDMGDGNVDAQRSAHQQLREKPVIELALLQ